MKAGLPLCVTSATGRSLKINAIIHIENVCNFMEANIVLIYNHTDENKLIRQRLSYTLPTIKGNTNID